MNKILLTTLAVALTTLSGCLTKGAEQAIATADAKADMCITKVLDNKYKIAEIRAKGKQVSVQFKDERNYLMSEMIIAMKDMNIALIESQSGSGVEFCDDRAIARLNMESRKLDRILSLVDTGLKIGGGVWAIRELGNFGNNGGSSTGDTWNVSGSRFNSKSGNNGGAASSSGAGLGQANSFESGAGNQASGLFPRQANDTNGTTSNSGPAENPVTLPVEATQ